MVPSPVGGEIEYEVRYGSGSPPEVLSSDYTQGPYGPTDCTYYPTPHPHPDPYGYLTPDLHHQIVNTEYGKELSK